MILKHYILAQSRSLLLSDYYYIYIFFFNKNHPSVFSGDDPWITSDKCGRSSGDLVEASYQRQEGKRGVGFVVLWMKGVRDRGKDGRL